MRVSSINIAQPKMANYHVKNQNVQTPNFRGIGGVMGSLLGAGAGLFLTAASGGALFWTIPALCGSGAIGGDIFEKKDKPSTDVYGQ